VIGVDDNPDGVSRELQGQVNGIAEPADRAPVGAKHRVQGFHAESHACSLRDRDKFGDTVGDHPPRRFTRSAG